MTRHLFDLDYETIEEGISNVCALSPGVMGTTGIETSDIIKAIVDKINLDYIIVVDALKAASINRINKSIQLTNSGISPGSGVGNKRKELSKDTLGIPVIAIGVPTVVEASTIASNTIDYLLNHDTSNEVFADLKKLDPIIQQDIINSILSDLGLNLIVAPKEIDIEIENLSEILSGAINHALHEIE